MEPKRVCLLINPSARSGRGCRGVPRLFTGKQFLTEVCESRSAAHYQELVCTASEREFSALALVGGDGTVALALNATQGLRRVPWLIVPAGSGNDFAKDLNIATVADAIGALGSGFVQRVDAGIASFGNQTRRYCCVASVGLDTLALHMIHGSRWPRSKTLNVVASLRALWRYQPCGVRITWADGSFTGEVMFAAVTNTRGYGGGFLVSPRASLQDGLLDLCIVRRTGRFRLLTQFPRILRGTHESMPEVIQAQTPWVRIEGLDEPLPVALDGDLPEGTTPVELRCEPSSVQVMVPASWKPGM